MLRTKTPCGPCWTIAGLKYQRIDRACGRYWVFSNRQLLKGWGSFDSSFPTLLYVGLLLLGSFFLGSLLFFSSGFFLVGSFIWVFHVVIIWAFLVGSFILIFYVVSHLGSSCYVFRLGFCWVFHPGFRVGFLTGFLVSSLGFWPSLDCCATGPNFSHLVLWV